MMTSDPSEPSNTQQIAACAEAALSARFRRVQRIDVAGQFYWVKSEEKLTLRMRVQKGDPHRAFEVERQAMIKLGLAGMPVPEVVVDRPGYFVMKDGGRSLRQMLRDEHVGVDERLPAFEAAAKGLAGFHATGLSHGRPSIKDICWDGSKVTFLDLERYASKRNSRAGHIQDLVILIFSALADAGRRCPEIDALIESYRREDSSDIWDGAQSLCRRLRWFDPLTWPIRQFRQAREFKAIPLTLEAFGVR